MVIEVSNVSDPILELLAKNIFEGAALKSSVDKALRSAMLKEIRLRAETPARLVPSGPFLTMIPEMRPFELLAASFSLIDKIIKLFRMSDLAAGGRDLTSHHQLEDTAHFLIEVCVGIVEEAKRQCEKEKRGWN